MVFLRYLFMMIFIQFSLVTSYPIGKEKQMKIEKGAHGFSSTCAYFDWTDCGKKKKSVEGNTAQV